MNPMRRYKLALLVLWIAGAVAAWTYARQEKIDTLIAAPVALAMLLELSCYLALAFGEIREWMTGLATRLVPALFVSALIPYGIYVLASGGLRPQALAALVALSAVVSGWFFVLPHRRIFDVGLLVFMAAVYLADVFEYIYVRPVEGLDIEILGQLMWIRIGITVFLLARREEGIGFGFSPTRREWVIGVVHFAIFLPLGAALIYGLDFARFDPVNGAWWKAPGMFFAFLWVVALSEEFFFRGLLQRWLIEGLGRTPGLVLASLAFGAVHLPFREFPNWEFAALATVAGFFYGSAFLRGGSIRSAMVTHALVVTVWRTLFR